MTVLIILPSLLLADAGLEGAIIAAEMYALTSLFRYIGQHGPDPRLEQDGSIGW